MIIPTFNERDALPGVLADVLAVAPDADVLVVDDDSPDGTGAVADTVAAEQPRVRVLHRTGRRGLGRAYLAGFAMAIAHEYDIVVEMDADGSHPANTLPRMLATLESAEPTVVGVIGSRWVDGGSVLNWPRYREWISRAGSAYSRVVLGLDIRDVTAGFRAYRVGALQSLALDSVASKGYCFQVDLTRRLTRAGGILIEVPIEFREREIGVSKMTLGIVAEAMLRVTGWGIQRLFRRGR